MTAPETDFFQGTETHRPAFNRQPTPAISYGLRFPDACAKHVTSDLASERVYVIASSSLANKTDALQQLTAALGSRIVGVRKGVGAHTPLDHVVEIVAEARNLDVDCLVTLGSGSITDCAKIVRFALANSAHDLDSVAKLGGDHNGKWAKPTIRLICIPTSLSGGEYQARAGATDPKTLHKNIFYPGAEIDLVIQDPELCSKTPDWLWFSSGIRAVDHCVETLCSLLSNKAGDECSGRGLDKLVPSLLQTKANPQNLRFRHTSQLGVIDSMEAVSSGIPLGASHAIGHQLGPLGVGHGETSCIMLPAVCKYNASKGANNERQALTVAHLLKNQLVVDALRNRGLDPAKVDLGDTLDVIITELGMPRSLEELHIGPDKLATIASSSIRDPWCKTNAVPITEESQVMDILKAALKSPNKSK
ncbi:hypothetical protein CDD81_4002 [Ophiocordyceps australis]|uniref:Uncharacterized protein n=1 Tax=Ophiocordyceps australis TaxID=1399860 RepID=A0A2C5YB97_9HYPO|nr:hypothetical protein CDD81_4002 [Ophiocordyceps australis]